MDEQLYKFLDELPEDWIKLLQPTNSSPLSIALVYGGKKATKKNRE